MEGELHLSSDLGKGSTFTLEFPLVFEASPSVKTKEQEAYPLKNLGILIVDDDEPFLEMLQKMCGAMGAEVQTYSSFHQVPHKNILPYDVVVTDLQMPKINGLEVLEMLRSKEYDHYKNQPIVVMTGQKNMVKKDLINKGFASVLIKPFDTPQFLEVLMKLKLIEPHSMEKQGLSQETPDGNQPLFSLENLKGFLGNDPKSMHDVLTSFLNNLKKDLKTLEQALDEGNLDVLANTAHRMLPMLKQLGATVPVHHLQQLEMADKNGSMGNLKEVYHSFRNSATLLQHNIERYLTTHPFYNG